MGSVVFECPQCGGSLEADASGLQGRLVVCPHCEAQIQIPKTEEDGADEAPAQEEQQPEAGAAEGGSIQPGTVLRNVYKIEEPIGHSSLGEMYVASRVPDGAKVQLEVLVDADQEKIDRLSREVELLASLQHESIVRAFDAGQDGDIFFLASEHTPGQTLERILTEGAIDEGPALMFARDIAAALQYAWEQQKILHRDVKPPNIFIPAENRAKLMGFGIAKSGESQSMGLTGVGFTIGTPEYMSPEQIKAEDDLDFRSDMYALGCVLYEMVTGSLPFDEDAPILLMQKQMDEDPEPPSERSEDVSAECSDTILWMMQKPRDERPQSWDQLIGHIDQLLSGDRQAAAASTPTHDVGVEPKRKEKKTKKKGCALGMAALLGLAGSSVYLLARLLS